MRYAILLHRIRDGYVTMVDIFRTVVSAGQLEDMLVDVGSRFSDVSYVGVSTETYLQHTELLAAFGFELDRNSNQYVAPWSEPLETALAEQTDAEARVYTRKPYDPAQRELRHCGR